MSSRLAALWLALLLALGACTRPEPASPALWQVSGPHGETGWLFGTIHALPRPVDWRSEIVERALARSDRLVVEVARMDAAPAAFAELSRSPGLPPLDQRLPAATRPVFAKLARAHGLKPSELSQLETWAAALMVQQALARDAGVDGGNGIDRALVSSYPGRVEELEGAAAQLAIFDRLPEPAQRALLAAVLQDQNAGDAIFAGWARGDLAPIEAETERGFLGNPDLRAALLSDRNRAWAGRIDALLKARAHPFVAVGAAHMAGSGGLPALLAARGWQVTRIQ